MGVRGSPGRSRGRPRPSPSGLSGGRCTAVPAEGALRPALRLRARGDAPPPPPAIAFINLPRNGRRVIGEEKGCLRPPRPRPATPRAAPNVGADVGTHSARPGAAPSPTVPLCPGHPFPAGADVTRAPRSAPVPVYLSVPRSRRSPCASPQHGGTVPACPGHALPGRHRRAPPGSSAALRGRCG